MARSRRCAMAHEKSETRKKVVLRPPAALPAERDLCTLGCRAGTLDPGRMRSHRLRPPDHCRHAYAGNAGIERDLPPVDPGDGQSQRLAAREGRFYCLLVGSTGVSEPLPAAETRLGRRTALTFPLLPPPQKN
jgi:hypothetical protein